MRRTILVAVFVGFIVVTAGAVQADHTFPPDPGPYLVASGTPVTVVFNDAANTAAVPSPAMGEVYLSFTFTADWVVGVGNPWSSEADMTLNWGGSSVTIVDPPTSGAGSNANPTTLVFSGNLFGYDPAIDGTLEVVMNQSFAGSDATWSNLNLTVVSGLLPPPPMVIGTLVPDQSSPVTPHVTQTVTWYAVTHPGGDLTVTTDYSDFDTELGVYSASGALLGNDDDGGLGPQSAVQLPGLLPGVYYAAASGFNTTFAADFTVTPGDAEGNLQVHAFLGLVPVELVQFTVE
jgi:hypothetical protein